MYTGARSGSRTRMRKISQHFKCCAYTIPPSGQKFVKPEAAVRFALTYSGFADHRVDFFATPPYLLLFYSIFRYFSTGLVVPQPCRLC